MTGEIEGRLERMERLLAALLSNRPASASQAAQTPNRNSLREQVDLDQLRSSNIDDISQSPALPPPQPIVSHESTIASGVNILRPVPMQLLPQYEFSHSMAASSARQVGAGTSQESVVGGASNELGRKSQLSVGAAASSRVIFMEEASSDEGKGSRLEDLYPERTTSGVSWTSNNIAPSLFTRL